MLVKVIKGQEVRIKMLKIKNRHTNFVFVIKYHVINKSIYHIRYCLQFLIRFLPTLCPVFNYITRSIVINPLAPNDIYIYIQGDSFRTRPKKMRISQRLFIRF